MSTTDPPAVVVREVNFDARIPSGRSQPTRVYGRGADGWKLASAYRGRFGAPAAARQPYGRP